MSDPLAYFLTFTTFGSRLPGDDRGSVDRDHNTLDAPRLTPNQNSEGFARKSQSGATVVFNVATRTCVDDAIRERCEFAGWHLLALNVRTNHVHVVVSADPTPEVVMTSFKAWATRRLVSVGLVAAGTKVWSRHGSTRYVWDEEGLESVCIYTNEFQ